MIQRIQTLFLLGAAIFSLLILFYSSAKLSGPAGTASLEAFGIQAEGISLTGNLPAYPIGVLAIISVLLSTLTIFKYKNRQLQIRLCSYNIILLILEFGLMIAYGLMISSENGLSFYPAFGIIAAAVSIIFLFLASRNIKKDEAIVKSLDRIR